MNILITGSCGFIGFHLANEFLKSKKNKVFGIDNINNYYSTKLKNDRLKILKKKKNFIFKKLDINNHLKLKLFFEKYKIDTIYHLAAQAGVRYSILHPKKYLSTNITGFFNIIENVKNFKIKNFFYASSSSVYGDLKTFPLKEDFNLKYKNIYALTKNVNEKISEIYQKFYKVRSVGLRFFTVYGEFGRPDMFMMKYILSIKHKKLFSLYNYGNHYRDFTYVGDVVNILVKLLKCKLVKNNEIFNVCSSNPQKITKIIKLLNEKFKNSPNIKKIKFQDADVLKTFGSNLKIRKVTKFVKFTPIKEGIEKLSNWAKFYYKM